MTQHCRRYILGLSLTTDLLGDFSPGLSAIGIPSLPNQCF